MSKKVTLKSFIRDTNVIWYGPHNCNKCGEIIIKSAYQQGGVELDAGDFNHNYPNWKWTLHKCSPPIPEKYPKSVTYE